MIHYYINIIIRGWIIDVVLTVGAKLFYEGDIEFDHLKYLESTAL